MSRRRIEIIRETWRRLHFENEESSWCPGCRRITEFIPVTEAADVMGGDVISIWHVAGQPMVCAECVKRLREDKS
jgi:hypothetical protein